MDQDTERLDGEQAGTCPDATRGPQTFPTTAEAAAAGPVESDQRRAALEQRELKGLLEALLFVSHEPVTVERLAEVIGGISNAELVLLLHSLREDYDRDGRGLQLVEVAHGFQLLTRPDYSPWLKRLEKAKAAPKLSRSALESVAIIGYRQPITRGEIEHIRGVETSTVLRTLLERKLVRIVGRKDVPGRPMLYGTTRQFLQQFGLRNLADLPPLREFKELGGGEQAILPVGDDPLTVGETNGEPAPDEADPSWDNDSPDVSKARISASVKST